MSSDSGLRLWGRLQSARGFSPFFVLATALAAPSPDSWLRQVEPVMTAQERQSYLALVSEDERETFRAAFWNDKTVTAEQYFERATYIDARFGSGKLGSGGNTDRGRVYLSLGPPTSISHLPSSRLFVPVEIWRYDHVAGLPVSSEIQLLFYQARNAGFMKLYSPQLHTIRALIINNAGTRGAFPVNDVVTADDVANRLRLSPAEMEVMDAAMSVARGVRGSGNSELLYRIASPAVMIRRGLREKVQSRIYTPGNRPQFSTTQYRTADRIPAIEISVRTTVQSAVGIEVAGLESVETKVAFAQPTPVSYHHRLYLLPGSWNITLISDGQRTIFPLKVHPLSNSDPEAPADLMSDAEAGGVEIRYRANLNAEAQWVSVGRQYLRANDLPRAAFCYRKAIAGEQRNPDALAGYGRLLALQNRLDEARTRLLEALQLDPEHYEALVGLAGVTAKLQDYPQALEYYRQAQALRPTGDIETAIRELRKLEARSRDGG